MSPIIGPAGNRACAEMISAARMLFAERGYHATSTTAIAEATGRSDTAFYQYFSSKRALYQMFFEELGQELLEHFDRIPDFGSDESGLATLRGWLAQLGLIFRSHSAAFLEWPSPGIDEPASDNPQEPYFARFVAAMRSVVGGADLDGLEVRTVTLATASLVAYSNVVLDTRHRVTGHLFDSFDELDEVLARMMHRALFPSSVPPSDVGGGSQSAEPPLETEETLLGLRKPVTRRARPTIDRVLAGAESAFLRKGLAGTSVNEIIEAAGVGHGTFYTYWSDRTAIFETMMHRAATAVRAHLAALVETNSPAGLETWLAGWLDVVERHGATLHIWTSEIVDLPPLQPLGAEMDEYLWEVAGRLLGANPVLRQLDRRAATAALWALLMEFPYSAWRRNPVLTRAEVLHAQRWLLGRGYLGWAG
ncbi:TetR/AcrR family transcriptional regulator [Cryptosporangium aurantiacum]|nr:TetR/AcrR family transcriptional regulator [Cryptosporangium aurantiacum]